MLTKVDPLRLTVHNVAERLNVSDETVRRWIASGELEAYNVGIDGDRPIHRTSEAALQAFLDARKSKGLRKVRPRAAERDQIQQNARQRRD